MAQAIDGKTAVITGGTSGIGLAVARALHAAAANVVLAGRRVDGERAAAELGSRARFVATDVRVDAEVQRLFDTAASSFGGIDFLFNNAGIEGPLATIDAYPEDALDDVLATNLKGPFLAMKHAIPRMRERGGGVVVNNASTVGTLLPFPLGALYGATKAALVSLTQAAAATYADAGMTFYATCPWITDTPMIDRLTGGQADAKSQFGAINPGGRIVTTGELAAVVLELFAGGGRWASGDAIAIDTGGATRRVERMAAAAREMA